MNDLSKIPTQRGKMAKDEKGNLVLINEEQVAFAINADLSKVWLALDGNHSIKEIIREFSKNAKASENEITDIILKSIQKLDSAELVAWKDYRSNSSETSDTSI